jgi:hypothetical protein
MQLDQIKRREFIGLVGGAATCPLTATAQQAEGKIITIGVLAIEPWPPIDTFRQALERTAPRGDSPRVAAVEVSSIDQPQDCSSTRPHGAA